MLASITAAALSLLCCEKKPQPQPSDDSVKPVLVLKESFEKLPQDDTVKEIRSLKGGYSLEFSSGAGIVFDTQNYALVTVDDEGWLCINGDRSIRKFIENPRYTVGPEGLWYKDGAKTYKRATPENSLAGGADTYLVNVIQGPRSVTAQFSDMSSMVFPRERKTEIFVKKSASRMDIFVSLDGEQYLDYPFNKRYKAWSEGGYPSFLDNWGMGALELHKRDGDAFSRISTLFLSGEAEMALNVTSGNDPSAFKYVGGTLHGFENLYAKDGAEALTIEIDGRSIAPDETFALTEAGSITMTQRSLIYQAHTNSNPFAEVFRKWTFEGGDLHIRVDVKFLRDMEISQAQFGMLCVLRRWEGSESQPYLTCWALKDNVATPYDVTDGWTGRDSSLTQRDHGTNRITEYGEKGFSFALCADSDSDLRQGGGMFVGTNGNAYNKIYFDMLGRCSIKAGECVHSHIHWEIDKQ